MIPAADRGDQSVIGRSVMLTAHHASPPAARRWTVPLVGTSLRRRTGRRFSCAPGHHEVLASAGRPVSDHSFATVIRRVVGSGTTISARSLTVTERPGFGRGPQ
jgi:hypothetical protein